MTSTGIKRYLATILGAITLLTDSFPSLSVLSAVVAKIAAVLGGVGLLHGAKEKTLGINLGVSIGAFIQLVIGAATYVHEIQPFVPFLQELSLLIAAFHAGKLRGIKFGLTRPQDC